MDPSAVDQGFAAQLVAARAVRALQTHSLAQGDEQLVVIEGQGIARGKVVACSSDEVKLSLKPLAGPFPRQRLFAVVGLSRPQTVKKVLELAAATGLESLHFVSTERGEKSYLSATVLQPQNIAEHLLLGAEQSGESFLPKVFVHTHIKRFLGEYFPLVQPGQNSTQPAPVMAFLADTDVGTECSLLRHQNFQQPLLAPIWVAIGPEAGWSKEERDLFLERGFKGISLGPRQLRVEQALAFLLGQVQLLAGR